MSSALTSSVSNGNSNSGFSSRHGPGLLGEACLDYEGFGDLLEMVVVGTMDLMLVAAPISGPTRTVSEHRQLAAFVAAATAEMMPSSSQSKMRTTVAIFRDSLISTMMAAPSAAMTHPSVKSAVQPATVSPA